MTIWWTFFAFKIIQFIFFSYKKSFILNQTTEKCDMKIVFLQKTFFMKNKFLRKLFFLQPNTVQTISQH